MSSIALRRVLTAALTAALVLMQVPSSLWPQLAAYAPTTAAAAPELDQQQPTASATSMWTIGGAENITVAQTVTAGISGALTSVDLPIYCPGGGAIHVEIQGLTPEGKPNGTRLAEMAINASDIGTTRVGQFWNFGWSFPASFTRGDKFAIVVYDAIPSGQCGWAQHTTESYPGGAPFNKVGAGAGARDWLQILGDNPFKTYVERAPEPDLVVTSFSAAPATVTPGGTATFSWTITNQGTATATISASPPAWIDQVWLSTSQTSVSNPGPPYGAGGIVAPVSLAPGESYSRTMIGGIHRDLPPGNYYFILQTDSNAQIGESREDNNLSVAVPVTVIAPAFTVISLDDVDDGVCDSAHCSLREAIAAANAAAGSDRIHFAIPGTGPHTIAVTGVPLPPLSGPVILDGLTQPGAAAGAPMVVLNGSGLTAGVGLAVTGGNSQIRGLAITRFPHAGVHLLTNGGNSVAGNMIGGASVGNRVGVVIESSNNVIGGATAGDRNVISGNSEFGVLVLSGTDNVISGNYIGTDVAGVLPRPNGGSGIVINGSAGNRIGGATAAERNVISGNSVTGVTILGAGATGNTIQGNYIGIGSNGSADVANTIAGVDIQSANNVVRGNVISANNKVTEIGGHGVVIESVTATGNVIAGNLIGPRADGTRGFPNAANGVLIRDGASNNTIGGTSIADRNIISGNARHGVHIASDDALANTIQGNYIGLEQGGEVAFGNRRSGIAITGGGTARSTGTTIRGNTIAANTENGITIERAPAPHAIDGNVIGLSASALNARPNLTGLYAYLDETPVAAAMQIQANRISANTVHGVYLYGVGGATLSENKIGLAGDGSVRGNGSGGITLLYTSAALVQRNEVVGNAEGIVLGIGNTIGSFDSNIVRANGTTGFVLNGPTNLGNRIEAGSITGHSGKGIALINGANNGITAPAVTTVSVGDGLSVSGTGAAGNTISIYADPADEGLEYLGTAIVGAGGTWSKSSGWAVADTSAIEAAVRAGTRAITATQTDANRNTSEFSSGKRAPALARGTAQLVLSDGTATATTILPGATVRLVGTERVTTAAVDGRYSFADLSPNTKYAVRYEAVGALFSPTVAFTTDATGAAEIPAPGTAFNRKNHSWLSAFRLTDGVAIADQTWREGQSVWYRFSIAPYSRVQIEVRCPDHDCNVVAYRDLIQVANALQSATGLAGVRADLAGNITAEDMDAEDMDAEDMDADDMDAEDMDAEDMDAEDMDAEDMDAEDMDAEDMDAEDMDAEDMDADDMDAEDMDADGDGDSEASVYVSAQRRGIRAVSANEGLAPESIVINTRSLTGDLYIRVRGDTTADHGAVSVVATRMPDPSCVGAALLPRSPVMTVPSGNWRSLILTDTNALGLGGADRAADRAAYLAKLADFAAHTTVLGHVLDLAGDGNVQLLRADWLAAPTCVGQANLLADAVRMIVQSARAASTQLEYVIIAGGDRVVPFHRDADWAEISRESRYSPPVDGSSPSEASLVADTILTDDFYVTATPIERNNRTLYLPDLAIGRLVESRADIEAYIDMYLATNGRAAPTTGLSSGYDFNLDLAAFVTAQLQASGVTVNSTLTSDVWSAQDWRNTVLNTADRFGILSLQGHFSANRLVPADNGQRVLSTEIASLTDGRFRGALVYSLGCHSGYSIVDPDALPGLTQPVAFPEAFLRQGATLVGGTGYQYGETELIKNTELLIALLTQELGYSNDASGATYLNGAPIGKALIQAKRAYMAQTATPRGLDYKVLGVSTVFGSPTMSFALPNTAPRPTVADVRPTETLGGGLSVVASDTATPLDRNGATGQPQYYDAAGGTATAPYRPIAPLITVPSNMQGSVLTGVTFLGGAYSEEPFTPRLSVPATEESGEAPRYVNDVYLPLRPVRTSVVAGDTVHIIPFQYLSNIDGSAGTARTYANVAYRAYYWNAASALALVDAPVIELVQVTEVGGQLQVRAVLRGNVTAEIAEVWATFTNINATPRAFSSVAMTGGATQRDPAGTTNAFTREYTATLPAQAAGNAGVRLMVQAVSGTGRVETATNGGQLFGLGTGVARPPLILRQETTTVLTSPASAASAAYRSRIDVSALVMAGGTPLAGKPVTFDLEGSTKVERLTGADGVARATLDVSATPRATAYTVTATFAGDAGHAGSGDSEALTVTRAATQLQAAAATVQYSDGVVVATLRAGLITLNEQPIVLTVGATQVATATDFAGQVRFETLDFSATAPVTVGISYPGNARYAPATASATVDVRPETATVVLAQLEPQATGAITVAATVAQQADGAPGDLTRASVELTFTPVNGTAKTVTAPVSAAGAASVTHTLAAGLYTVTARVVGAFTSDTAAMTLPVYDPSVFVSGGGWVPTGATPTGVTPNARGTFGFVAKYLDDNVTPTGNLLVHVKSANGKDGDSDAQAAANGSFIFRSTSYGWLVISGSGAAFTGTGTVNGATGYSFRVDAVDGSPDQFVLHVWDASGSYAQPAYVVRGTLGGGNVRIHR